MFDLESEEPTFFWMFDGDDTWKADRLSDVKIDDNRIAFDYSSPDWEQRFDFVAMDAQEDGYYLWQGTTHESYKGLRAESASHVVLVGHWREDGSRGPCVIVLPKLTI